MQKQKNDNDEQRQRREEQILYDSDNPCHNDSTTQ